MTEQVAKRISQLNEKVVLTGDEEIPSADGNSTIKFKIRNIKTLVNKSDVGLANVDNTSDLNKPVSTATQSALNGKANVIHNHAIVDIVNLQATLDNKADLIHEHTVAGLPEVEQALNTKSDINHTHTVAQLPDVQIALNNKAGISHLHNTADITGLDNALSNKASVIHQHTASEITDFDARVGILLQDAGIVAGDVTVDNLEW